MYTTPLSSSISSLNTPSSQPIRHHLHADDTQFFISFSPSDLLKAQSVLMQTIHAIFEWMMYNILSLNLSKTEFLLIGLPQQLAKLSQNSRILSDNTTISATTTARNLGIILDSNLSFKQHISSLSKSCFYHIRDLRRIPSTLDFDTARTIATSLVHSNWTTATRFTINPPNTANKFDFRRRFHFCAK